MSNTVYAVVLEDRHCDVGVYLFIDKDKAIAYAKEIANASCRRKEDYEEEALTEFMIKDGWEFNVTYSCEGDSVSVRRCEIQ